MSSSAALRQKLSAREILVSHFQLPLYLRLLLEAYPQAQEKDLQAYLVSIRDGVVSNVLGKDTVPELKSLISDDTREDGLAASIKRVMTPIIGGQLIAKRNDSCSHCHLKSVCRIRSDDILESEHE